MTLLNAASSTTESSGYVAPIARWAARTWAELRRRQDIERAVEQLEALDDHMLADIGLSRSEIRRVATFGRYERPWR